MKYLFQTYQRSCMIEITVKTVKPQKIRVKAYPVNEVDKKPFPNTLFTDRYATIIGEEKFLVKLPKTSQETAIQIYNDALGEMPKGQDRTFSILKMEKKILPTQLFMFEFTNPIIASFVSFAEDFAFRCGYLSVGIRYSPDALFRIDYKAGKLMLDNGKTSTTPARIGADSAIVEVSKESFLNFTTAGRFVILLHEFCHFYKNKQLRNEEEADFYAVNIALGKGYSEVELLMVYAKIFTNADTPSNRKRYERIKKYISDFSSTSRKRKLQLQA